jgi:diaminohydroxyphosphoribosylaminopyrimidine deaminase/5-amino-6-(5-phosphoribosylamino)uracil reductase
MMTSSPTEHDVYMQRCIQLAMGGQGLTAPNPLVGCVIVANGRIIGEGYHQHYGEAHAEVNAIHHVKDKSLLKEATLYVNLEPCAHHGKTPPCSEYIISQGITRVVIGSRDPHSLVAGKGIEKLQNAGVAVTVGVLEKECYELNKRFFTYHEQQRPYIILKWAQTQDGFIDRVRTENRAGINWITGAETKRTVHLWRSQEGAILVGKNTVLNDDPSLTVRAVQGNHPLRFVIDKNLEVNPRATVFDGKVPTTVFNAIKTQKVKENLNRVQLNFDGTELHQIMQYLYEHEVQSIIIEGGAFTLQQFIEQGLWDEARVLTGKVKFENGLAAPVLHQTPNAQSTIGEDILHIYHRG